VASDKETKTEKPTERRLTDAESKGDVPRSKDMANSVSMLLTLFFFLLFIPTFGTTLINTMKFYFSRAGELPISISNIFLIGRDVFYTILKLVMPIFLLLITVAFMIEIIQGKGFRIVTENLRIKWEKVFIFSQIVPGLKKIIGSVEAMFEILKSIVKIISIGVIGYFSLIGSVPAILDLPNKALSDVFRLMGKVFFKVAFNIILFLLAISVLDFLWQKYQYTKKLRMSKQDIKDEFKQAEGDPQVKQKQKRIQFQWAMRRMMAEVPHADVVITNPTHFAVAIKYEAKKMKSPKVLAKGQDLVALRIREIAIENKIPVVENPPVARALFEMVEIDGFIPENMFKPVAEILAYIYKLKGKRVS